jgi:hypothetical protein
MPGVPELPDTDSRDVMEMSVALWITSQVWEQVSRAVHTDDSEEIITNIYTRVYKAVKGVHTA